MKEGLFIKENKKIYGFWSASLCIVLFLTRTSIPFFKYPFLIIFLVFSIITLIKYNDRILQLLKDLGKSFWLILVLFSILLLSALFSDKLYLAVVKDLINVIILLSLFYITKLWIRNKSDHDYFLDSFFNLMMLFGLIISMQRLINFFYFSSYFNSFILKKEPAVDYNFVLVPVFLGMLGTLYSCSKRSLRWRKITFTIVLFIFSINFLLSGSKRGIFLFVVIFLCLIAIQLRGIFIKNSNLRLFIKNTINYTASFLIFILAVIMIMDKTSVYFKNRILEKIGIKNISYTKYQISETIFKYVHALNKDVSNKRLYSALWHPVFDSKNPDAGYGNGNYKIINRLYGKNVEIVPPGSKGYLLDNFCVGGSSAYHSYYFLPIRHELLEKKDSVSVSVFCYVSEDFDGDAVAIRAEGTIEGNSDKFYDLKNKGCWQKLNLPLSGLPGDIIFYLYMNKYGVKDFTSLKGNVIFAYPEFKFSYKLTRESVYLKKDFYNGTDNIYGGPNNSVRNTLVQPTLTNKYEQASFSSFLSWNFAHQNNKSNDKDPIRNWISKITSEDTTYHGFKTNLISERINGNFGEDRLERWKFALQIFRKEYNWTKKIIGGGFNFLNWYGYIFKGDKTKSDYPHNPFLHILLYSGIVGLFFYLWLLYKVFYYYIKYIKEYYLFFIFFLVTYFFTFFSGGIPFDPPITGFFMILPFFIHSVLKNEEDGYLRLNSEEAHPVKGTESN
jgi:hypothetical protein